MNAIVYFYHYRNGSLDVVTFLVEKCQVEVNVTNKFNQTPLHLACE